MGAVEERALSGLSVGSCRRHGVSVGHTDVAGGSVCGMGAAERGLRSVSVEVDWAAIPEQRQRQSVSVARGRWKSR